MPDKQDEKANATTAAPAPEVRTIVVSETEETRRSRDLSLAQAEAVRLKMDETVVGGRYVVNGQTVDAHGKPVKD